MNGGGQALAAAALVVFTLASAAALLAHVDTIGRLVGVTADTPEWQDESERVAKAKKWRRRLLVTAAAAIVALLRADWYSREPLSDAIRVLGWVLQTAGVLVAAQGIANVRREFTTRPGLWRTIERWLWLRWRRVRRWLLWRLLHRRETQTISVGPVQVDITVGTPTVTKRFAPVDPSRTPGQRIEDLERQVRMLNDEVNRLTIQVRDDRDRVDSVVRHHVETVRRDVHEVDQSVHDLAGGGLRIEAWGVVLFLLGNLFVDLPGEVARLVQRLG